MAVPIVKPGEAEFPLNTWYVAAFSREVKPGELLGRTICGKPLVLYRRNDGTPVALFDRCPHRGMPLSMGKLVGNDRLQCTYHGLEFVPSGQCALVPSQDHVPPFMTVKAYPVTEKWKWLWVWPGDPDKADPALIPDHDYLGFERNGWETHDGLVMHLNANYLLPFENLVDATHISYLHHGLIDDGNAARTPYELTQDGIRVRLTREIRNEVVMGRPAQDRTLVLEGHAPQLCLIQQEINPSATPDARISTNLVIALTPETPRSTHQFTANAGSPGSGARRGSWQEQDAFLLKLLTEDVVAIEAIQRLHDSIPAEERVEVSQRADAGAARTRRIIAEMIACERPGEVAG